MSHYRRFRKFLGASYLFLMVDALPLQSADYTWAVGNGTWDTVSANWSGDGTTWVNGSGNNATFNSSNLTVNVSGAVTAGTVTFNTPSFGSSYTLTGIASDSLTFSSLLTLVSFFDVSGTLSLNASAGNAVNGGIQTFNDSSALNASAGNALSGGMQTFNNNTMLNASAGNAVSGGIQNFNGSSALNASAGNAVSGGIQAFNNNSMLNASAANAVSGNQIFNDNSMLNASTANALNGGLQVFYVSSTLNANAGNAVSGGGQSFNDNSILNASVANAVSGGNQAFLGSSILNASAGNALSGGSQGFSGSSTLNANVGNAVSGGAILLLENSLVNVQAANALSAGAQITFDASSGGPGGTLRLNGNSTSVGRIATATAGAGVIENAGSAAAVLTVDQASDSTFSGSLQDGTGGGVLGLTKQGAGTLSLSGSNSYTGATNIEEGILSFTGTSNLGSGTITVAGAELRIQGGGQLTGGESFVGVTGTGPGTALVDGSGSVWTINGDLHVGDIIPFPLGGTAGILRLTNNGSVQVNGTLELDIGGAIELGSGGNVAASGGLEVVFGTARLLAHTDFLLPDTHYTGNFTLDTNGYDGTYAGVISSSVFAGAVVKRGEGVLNLTGANSFTQGMYVEDGTLLVNNTTGSATGSGDVTIVSGSTLGGSGSIAGTAIIESGSTLSPGNSAGILMLGGLILNSGSITRMEINGTTAGTQYDQLQVTNAADLDGTLELVFGYVPTAGDTFTLITADSFTGIFSSITTNLGAALLAEEFYNPTTFEITVNLAQQDYAPFAVTPNQRAVSSNLDLFSTTGQYQELIDALNLLNADELRGAFDLIAPEELSAMSNVGFSNTRNIFNILGSRVNEIHNGQQFSSNGLTLWDNGKEFKENLLAGSDMVAGGKLYVPKPRDDKRFGFFVSGQGTFGDVDGDGNGDDYDFSTGGMVLGSDYRFTRNVAIGAYAGYQGSKSDTSGGSELQSDSAKFGVYGTYFNGAGSWLSANIGGGYHSYDSERATVGGDAVGSTNGTEINAQLTYGYEFKAGADKEWTFGPEASLGYTHLWIDGFDESGSAAPLQIQDQSNDSMRSTLSCKVSYDWKLNSGSWTLRPYGRLGWQHEFMDDNRSISARFAGAGGLFAVDSSDQDPDSLIASAGAQMLFSETISAELGYSAEANSDYEIHSITGSMNFRF